MKYVPTVVVFGIIVLLGGTRLLYLGPFGIRPGDHVLLAHAVLGDRCDFYAIGRRTESVTEPWGVTLYKVESNHRTSHYYLAFEDSYWWDCSIKSNDISHEVEIQANGKVTARYLPAQDIVLSDAYKIPIDRKDAKYEEVQQLLAQCKR